MRAKLVPLFLLLFMGAVWAVNPPEPGMQFYGHVSGALDGTVITAVIGDSTTTTVQNGVFGYAPNLFIVTRPTSEYSVVHIYIGGTHYADVNFQSGALYELNIDAGDMPFCGNGTCEGSESHESCLLDCPEITPTGGGALGGGAPLTAPPEENVPEPLGEPVTFEGDHARITLFGAYADTDVIITESTEPPSGLECPPLENVYTYLDVTVHGDYESGRVVFDVNASWYAENDLNIAATGIFHCVDGVWEDINAELVGEVNGVYTFTSGPTTFSVVAISTSRNVHEEVVEEPAETEEQPPQETQETPTGEEQTGEATPTGLAILGNNLLAVVLGVLALILVLVFFFRTR